MITKARKNKIGLTGSGTFHDRAIACCKENGYDYIEINYCQNDIIEQLADLDILLWTRDLESPADALIARHIVYAAELMGVKVCPDTACGWFYDDKISQKYLLEAIQAPLVPTYIFYDQKAALQWSQKVTFPMVLKLSKGAGSKNVILVENQAHAAKLIRKAFARGFKPAGRHIPVRRSPARN